MRDDLYGSRIARVGGMIAEIIRVQKMTVTEIPMSLSHKATIVAVFVIIAAAFIWLFNYAKQQQKP
jgi:preprotein translocase subunit YajC